MFSWKDFIGIEDAFRIEKTFQLSHPLNGRSGFGMADIVPLLEPQAVLRAHAPPSLGDPIEDVGLDHSHQHGIIFWAGDVQV